MYVDRSLSGDPKKDNLMDELNFNKCMCFKIKTTSKFFVGITVKGRRFIIHVDCFNANKIFSLRFFLNFKHAPNLVQDLSTPIKKALKSIY